MVRAGWLQSGKLRQPEDKYFVLFMAVSQPAQKNAWHILGAP